MPRPARPSRPAPEPAGAVGPSPAWAALVGLLLTCRYLQPTEAVTFGDTLWQAQLWLVAAAAWCWVMVRPGRAALRWSLLDLFVWLLALGHALSTLVVFTEGGDRRAAVNVAWEWAGLAATLFLVRQVFAAEEVRRPVRLFAAVTVGLASLGIWQHHVTFPANAAAYRQLRAEEDALTSKDADAASAADRLRLARIRKELASFGVPGEPGSRKRWEDRLLSTEPFATFGLANTLAGLLAAALPVVALYVVGAWGRRGEGTVEARRPQPAGVPPQARDARDAGRGSPLTSGSSLQAEEREGVGRRPVAVALGLGVSVTALLYCLLLTKSRTAWVGLAAGTAVAAGLHLARGRLSRRAVGIGVAAACGILLLGLLGLATGGLDREVFAEAPKSLKYRLDYWTGALRVLAERPLLGTGPANFRSYYLQHRSLGASEEIASPHDLFLDVWVAGGLLSLAALVGLLGYCGYRFATARQQADPTGEPAWGAAEWGFLTAFPVSMLVLLLSGQGIDARVAAVGVISAGVLFCLGRSNAGAAFVVGTGAGLGALAVHLLGADGIEFPAVVQTLLLLAASADVPRAAPVRAAGRLAPAGAFGGLALGCLLTGTAPVLNAGALTARAEALIEAGDPSADRALAEAAEADPWGTRPPALRAELATARALGGGSEADLETAKRRWEALLADQPRDTHARRRLAELSLARAKRTGDHADAQAAADRLAEAVALSPTDASLRTELARAWASAGRADEAREQAREALKLDDVNREAWHWDLVFPPETRAEMERLAGVGNAPARP